MAVVRWTFTDVYHRGPAPYTWTFTLNPNQGGALTMGRQVESLPTVGNRRAVAMEGATTESQLSFSGVILTREHLEAFEAWHLRRVLIELADDLGRKYRGVFSAFSPQRVRKAGNFWYHTYDATFTVLAYKNSSDVIYFGDFPTGTPLAGDGDGVWEPFDVDGGVP